MENTLIISDLHFPYQHKDALKFIAAAKDAYGLEVAKSTGDIVDLHTTSYHEMEYGVYSAKNEYRKAVKSIKKLEEIYPDLTVVLGNHDILTSRKAKTAGISLDHLKSYNEVYGVNWQWKDRDYFKVDKYNNCLLVHSASSSTLNNAKTHSHHLIQGHHHSSYGIEYFADTETLRWACTAGCLIDPQHPAFNYASKATLKRPILGMAAIIDDRPILIPMQLKKSGKWDGKV